MVAPRASDSQELCICDAGGAEPLDGTSVRQRKQPFVQLLQSAEALGCRAFIRDSSGLQHPAVDFVEQWWTWGQLPPRAVTEVAAPPSSLAWEPPPERLGSKQCHWCGQALRGVWLEQD